MRLPVDGGVCVKRIEWRSRGDYFVVEVTEIFGVKKPLQPSFKYSR